MYYILILILFLSFSGIVQSSQVPPQCIEINDLTNKLINQKKPENANRLYSSIIKYENNSKINTCNPAEITFSKLIAADSLMEMNINHEAAFKIYTEISSTSDDDTYVGHALSQLAYMNLNGVFVKKDVKTAVELYRYAARKLNPEGMFVIGYMTYNGYDYVQKDVEKGFRILKILADIKYNNISIRLVGYAYLSGIGVTRNYDKALEYLDASARRDDLDSQKSLGVLYSTMKGKYENKPLGYAWLIIYLSHGYDAEMHKFTNEQEHLISQDDLIKGQALAEKIKLEITKSK